MTHRSGRHTGLTQALYSTGWLSLISMISLMASPLGLMSYSGCLMTLSTRMSFTRMNLINLVRVSVCGPGAARSTCPLHSRWIRLSSNSFFDSPCGRGTDAWSRRCSSSILSPAPLLYLKFGFLPLKVATTICIMYIQQKTLKFRLGIFIHN